MLAGVEEEEMQVNAAKEEAVLKPGAKGKRKSRRAAKLPVKEEAQDHPAEPVRKRKRTATKTKKEAAVEPTSEVASGRLVTRSVKSFFLVFLPVAESP